MATAKKLALQGGDLAYQRDYVQAKVKVDAGGRVLIPAEFRKALGIKQGERLIMRVQGGEIRMWTVDEAVRRVQERVRRYIPEGRSLSDELIAERRREAELE